MTKSTLTRAKMAQPSDPYDTEAWLEFYDANPGFRRGVGAEGVNDDPDADADPADKSDDPADKSKDADPADDKDKSGKPSDAEAALLKDVMKQKEARREAEKRAKELEEQFGGIDIDEYKAMLEERQTAAEAKKKAEEQAAIDRGDFDKVREQMATQHEQELDKVRTTLTTELEDTKAELAKAASMIEELTIGSSFDSSKTIREGTIYTPSKARRLYGDHFEVEDGKVIAYDAPRGAAERTKIVDGKGNPADFETAMMRIIEADPEKDEILVASIKPGASSKPGAGDPPKKDAPKSSREKIMSGMSDLLGSMDKADDGGFKL